MVRLCQCIRIGSDLLIKCTQVSSCCASCMYIGTVFWTNFCIHRAAGYQLLRTIGLFIRCIRISNLASADSCAPGIFVGCLGFSKSLLCSILINKRIAVGINFNGAIVILPIYRIGSQICTDIAGIFFSILLQLFHDDDIVVILAVGDFDKAVVVSRGIRSFLLYFRRLCIIISCSINLILFRIAFFIGQGFPFIGITGFITSIMTKSYCSRLISCSLISQSR